MRALASSALGGRVKHWITLNEPRCCSVLGYALGVHAPGRKHADETEPYLVAHNMLLAHAGAVRIFPTEFQPSQGGQIGIVLNAGWQQPYDPQRPTHQEVAQRDGDFNLGWFADPVFFGDYPASMRMTLRNRLPTFIADEAAMLKGSSDFLGLNFYTSNYVRPAPTCRVGSALLRQIIRKCSASHSADIGVLPWVDFRWERTDMWWPIVPWGLRDFLLYLHQRYAPPEGIVVAENGCAHEPKASLKSDRRQGALVPKPYSANQADRPCEDFASETFHDPERERYIRAHLSAVHAALGRGADVRGYFCWSLMDNFEWSHGYGKRFGIVRVEYETQKRILKSSARFFAKAIADRGFTAPPREEQYRGTPF